MRTIVHDLARPLPADLGSFDHVATNPPYLAAAVADPSPDPSKALATVESSADLARWLAVATGAAKPAGTLLIIHRSDRLEEIVAHLVRLGWGDVTIKRLPPAARVLVRARRADCPAAHRGRRRSCCIGRRAATPTRPKRSCVTPRRLPSEARAATVPAMLGWLKDRFRRGPVVPVVRLSGVIASGGLLGGRGLSIESVAPLLKRAFDMRGAKAVALAINSPGGSPAQSALIAQRIRLLAEEKGLKVIAFVEDVAASGGYWLACAADEIVVDASSIVGSIGVISAGFGFQDLIARFGVERRVHTSGERKSMLDPFRAGEGRGCRATAPPAGRDP